MWILALTLGCTSIISKLSYVYPHMKFYAFEANPDTAQHLRESLRGRKVEVFDFALSDREGALEFVGGATSGVFGVKNHVSKFQVAGKVSVVPARTLDSVGIAGNSIVLKVDVESHEREVIEGGTGLFKDQRVKAVYLDGYSDRTLPDYLRSLGFLLFDGRTLKPATVLPEHRLLAIHRKCMDSHYDEPGLCRYCGRE